MGSGAGDAATQNTFVVFDSLIPWTHTHTPTHPGVIFAPFSLHDERPRFGFPALRSNSKVDKKKLSCRLHDSENTPDFGGKSPTRLFSESVYHQCQDTKNHDYES